MKTQLIRNFSVALLAAVSMYAQTPQSMIFSVPFNFHAGSAALPAGEYTVDTQAAPGVVRLRSFATRSSAMISSMPVQTVKTPGEGKLIFHKYGEDYFLYQLWKPGENTGRELPKTRREIEAAANTRQAVDSILARR